MKAAAARKNGQKGGWPKGKRRQRKNMTNNATAPIRQTTHAGQRVRTKDRLLRGIVLYHPDAEAYRKGLGWADAGQVAFVTAEGAIVDLPAESLEKDDE